MNVTSSDVAIVGAGPTGLSLGAELNRLGVSTLILDKQAAGESTSRACVVHARTLEVLEPSGAAEGLLQQGLKVSIFRIRDRSHVLATVDFKELKTAYPFTLMCPQDRVEAILLQRLQALGGVVERLWEVNGLRLAASGVEVDARNGQEVQTFRAQWVVGCDGAHSVVREKSSIPFEGGAYDESFILADAEMEWPLSREEVTLFYSDQGLVVVAPLPRDRFRIVATVRDDPAQPSVADFEKILAERGPQSGRIAIRNLAWSSQFHIQHRVAKAVRRGRVLLAGDAAHVHSPAGGQGMNTGIQDAVSLASALSRTLQTGDETILDRWQEERLKVAHSVVDFTDRLTKMATLTSPVLKRLRNTAVELIGNIPVARQAMAERLSELTYR